MKPEITSPANPQVKRVCAYQKKRKDRDRDGVFVAEGERLVTETPEEALVELYVSASYHAAMPRDAERFFARHREKTQVVSDEVFAKMSDTKTPQGVLAVVRQACCSGEEKEPGFVREGGVVIVLDGIQDPGNLGTILRSSEAAGVRGIVPCGDTADIWQPKVVRASMGSIFRVPVWQKLSIGGTGAADGAGKDAGRNPAAGATAEILRAMKKRGYRVAAADMAGSIDYDTYDWRNPTALVIGNEAKGLSDAARREADVLLRIPMEGKNESLNAAVAAAVLLFEGARQRRSCDRNCTRR